MPTLHTSYSAREDNTVGCVPVQNTNAHQRMASGHESVYNVNVPMQPIPLTDTNTNLMSSYHSSGNNSINDNTHQSPFQSYTSSPPLPHGPPLPPQSQLPISKSSASLSSSLNNVVNPLSNNTSVHNVASARSHTLSSSSSPLVNSTRSNNAQLESCGQYAAIPPVLSQDVLPPSIHTNVLKQNVYGSDNSTPNIHNVKNNNNNTSSNYIDTSNYGGGHYTERGAIN